ncbi:hypothetical protein QE152_g36564 [Popillia japonica]|uniref:SGNH hydrolase-type esterase domain-containing protein n=1 Tax=Popillia japonica TaxID=7064 RepID=A0AAW1IDG5_POPJA
MNIRPSEKLKRITDTRKRIFVFADSHGRDYGRLLNNKTGVNDAVQSIIKPGAAVEEVIKCLFRDIESLTKTDYGIVFGGANNIAQCVDSEKIQNLLSTYYSLMEKTVLTNLVICTIPFVCGRADYNRIIEHVNHRIYNMSKQFDHVHMCCINNLIYIDAHILCPGRSTSTIQNKGSYLRPIAGNYRVNQ